MAPQRARTNAPAEHSVHADESEVAGLVSRAPAETLLLYPPSLLKAKVTAQHVANAVLFSVTRRTPTTGATIPVDGGLPSATPR